MTRDDLRPMVIAGNVGALEAMMVTTESWRDQQLIALAIKHAKKEARLLQGMRDRRAELLTRPFPDWTWKK